MKKKRLVLDVRNALAFNEGEGDENKSTDVQVLRVIDANHGGYGRVKVTAEQLSQMVQNFKSNTYGQPIFFDVEHRSYKGAAGQITALRTDGQYLLADVTWTPYGVDAITNKRHELVSAEFSEEYEDRETGVEHGAVLLGAAITTRPFVKRMQPVQLSEDGGATTTIFLPENPEEKKTMNPRQKLAEKLKSLGLSEAHQTLILSQYDKAAKSLSDNAEGLESVSAALLVSANLVADNLSSGNSVAEPAAAVPKSLSEADIQSLVAKGIQDAETARVTKLTADEAADTTARKLFTDKIAEATGLPDATRKELSDQAADLVSAGMQPAAITKLAETLVSAAEREIAATKLTSLGFQAPNVTGTPSISVDHGNEVLRFSETVQNNLRQTQEHSSGRLQAPEEKQLSDFAKRYLGSFNGAHAGTLLHESRALSDIGQSNFGQYYLPQSFTREVIREALADLNIFALLRTMVDSSLSPTFTVPYEITDSGEIIDEAVLVERQMYPRISSRTANDIGYAQKRGAMVDVSEEAQLFTRNGPINYEAFAAAVVRCARIMRERIHAHAANHLLRISDTVGALPVVAEVLAYGVTDPSVIKLGKFPLVQPHQQRDLNGNAVGNPEHPIVVTVGGAVVPMYSGLPDLPVGTYYRVSDYNQGLLRLVTETGAPVTDKPAGTISYHQATNVAVFNMDTPADTEYEKHMNRLLQTVGRGKARMMQDQHFIPDYALMAHTLDDDVSNAQQFVQSLTVPGSESNASGVRKIKDIRTVNAAAPGMNLGENRILLGQAGNSTYHVTSPWTFGQPRPADATDAAGDVRYTGATVSHGNEFSGVHTPSPNAGKSTSVLVYSQSERAAL